MQRSAFHKSVSVSAKIIPATDSAELRKSDSFLIHYPRSPEKKPLVTKHTMHASHSPSSTMAKKNGEKVLTQKPAQCLVFLVVKITDLTAFTAHWMNPV